MSAIRPFVSVVDDDESVRQGLVDCLTGSASVRVEVARDGAEALHRIARAPFDVVVLDVMMPHMSGIDFLDSLSAHTWDPSLRTIENPPAVIVVTATSKDHLPDGELEVLGNCGHMSLIEEPDRVLQRMRLFFARASKVSSSGSRAMASRAS